MAALKILSLNTGNTLVFGGLLSIIRLEQPDIVFLQEITATSGQLKLYVAKYGYCAEANTDFSGHKFTWDWPDLEIPSASF